MVDDSDMNAASDGAPAAAAWSLRGVLTTLAIAVAALVTGAGTSAYLASRHDAPLTAEVERLKLEQAQVQQDLQAALAEVGKIKAAADAEKSQLLSVIAEKSAEADVARAAAEDARAKAADAERQKAALAQEKSKSKSDEAAKIAEAQADLKRAEAALKLKAAEIERQKQSVAKMADAKAVAGAPEPPKGLTLHGLAGSWQATLENKGKTAAGSIELTELGKGLAGTCTSLEICDGPNYTLAEASLDQNKVTLVFKYIYQFRIDLTINETGTAMQGTWTHGDMLGGKHSGTVSFQKS